MKTTKYRLILPMQAKGNVGKSIETAARACWLNQRGIHWQGFDLDGDNRTLSRLFPDQTKLVPVSGQADDLDELISILRKATAAPVTLVDPRAHLDGQLMKALQATHYFDIAKAQGVGITVIVFPIDDLDVMMNIDSVCRLRQRSGVPDRPQSCPRSQNANVRRKRTRKGAFESSRGQRHAASAVRICETAARQVGNGSPTRYSVQRGSRQRRAWLGHHGTRRLAGLALHLIRPIRPNRR